MKKHPQIDRMISLNHQDKTLLEIARVMGMSWQYVWKVIHTDKRYKPGKKGFGRLNKVRRKKIASRGGKMRVS